MTIIKHATGPYNKIIIYTVCNEVYEAGSPQIPREIYSTTSFETAALVLKFLRGDNMKPEDYIKARTAIKNADTQTVASGSTRKGKSN